MIPIITGLVMAYSFLYLVLTMVIASGERRMRQHPLSDPPPRVSVVVCARDEEATLRRCLESLAALDYPHERLEILLVDDDSEDGTRAIMDEFAARDEVFRVLTTAGEPLTLPGKQRPLSMGVRWSSGEYILITDADIAVQPGWVRAHLGAYDRSVGIVGGTTRVGSSSGQLFHRMQNCDLVSKHAVAMGCAGLKQPLSLMGNNLSFRREVYDRIGGYHGLNHTVVEDMALMNAVVTRTPYTLAWIGDPAGVVVSLPEPDMSTFVAQRYRWVYEVTDLSLIGKAMLAMESLMLASFIGGLALFPVTPIPLFMAAAAWITGYAVILLPQPGRGRGDLSMIPVTLVFQMVYGVRLAIKLLFGDRSMTWKGRTYRKT